MDQPGRLLPALLEAILEHGDEACFKVSGHSMIPLVRTGDVVRLSPLAWRGARPGDVVAVRQTPGDRLLIHRVIRREPGRWTVRGDSNLQADGVFTEAEIVGVVCAVVRRGREVWFGGGRAAPFTALAVRCGLIARLNRVGYPAYRLLTGPRRKDCAK